MGRQSVIPKRIVVLARPALARQAEAILRGRGHEVYRTPDDAGLVALVDRVRPHLVVIALDIPWASPVDSPSLWVRRLHPALVLFVGDVRGDQGLDGIPRIPAAFEPALLLSVVAELLSLASEAVEE
jgi:hypothetical protein